MLHVSHVRAENSSEVRHRCSAAAASSPLLKKSLVFCILSLLYLCSLLIFFYLSPSSLSPFFLLCASVLTPLFSYSSLLSSFSLPLLISPSLCWCCISQRDRLKQMPSWETGYVCVCMCVCMHCLHNLTHRRHAHNGSFPQMGEG